MASATTKPKDERYLKHLYLYLTIHLHQRRGTCGMVCAAPRLNAALAGILPGRHMDPVRRNTRPGATRGIVGHRV
jgi:hypothetical protein